jgi:Domain of unknown function (DUF4394)
MKPFLSNLPAAVCAAALLSTLSPCQADLIGYDGFDYRGSSMNNVEGGAFWGYQNIAPAGHKTGMSDWDDAPGFGSLSVSNGGLLYTSDSGVVREYNGPLLADETEGAVNDATVAKKVYYRVTMTRGTSATWCGVSSFDFANERLFFGLFPDGTGKFTIYDQNTLTRLALSTVNVNVGQTYTLVAKVDYAANTLALYVDPDLANSEAANTPVATAAYTGTQWSTAVRLGSGGTGLVSWDDLSVATTWESLRRYEVTTLSDPGPGSLRVMLSLARTTGGHVTFSPALCSIYAITLDPLAGTNRLVRFKRDSPGTLELNVPITGLQPDETIAAIDFRPATGECYALGNIPSLKVAVPMPQARLYRLNLTTGAATMVGSGPFSTTIGDFGTMGFDFNPLTDRITVTNEAGENLLLHPDTGAAASQTRIAFADGTAGSVRLLETAYSNNFPGTPSTRLYGFSNSGQVEIGGSGPGPNPTNGQAILRHAFQLDSGDITGFDIADDGMPLFSGFGSGSGSANYKSTLFQYDLTSGLITSRGLIGNGIAYVSALAAAPARITLASGSSPISVDGGNAFVVDGPSTAPGITLAGRGTAEILTAINGPALAFRNMTFTGGGGNQGGAVSYASNSTTEVTGLLSFDRCTFHGNRATTRGGVLSIAQGNLRLSSCTISGNSSGANGSSVIYQQHSGSFGSEAWGDILLTHCTVTGNHTTSTSAANPPQALVIPLAKTRLQHCLIAGNTNAASLPPDLRLSSDISAPAAVDHSLIGDGTGTGIPNGTNGNRVGTTAAPLLPLTAPLANYGGPTLTAPPLPASIAINLATTSLFTADQRGLLRSGLPDAGAAEFRGSPDLALWWNTDWDNDGSPFGMEFAVGTNPYLTDRSSPFQLQIQQNASDPVLTFNLDASARPYTRWIVKRSPNLTSFFEEIYRFNGPTSTGTAAPGMFTGNSGALFLLRDQPPNPARNFYRLEAVLVP